MTRQSENANATSYLKQRLSMAIQQGSTLSVLHVGTCNFYLLYLTCFSCFYCLFLCALVTSSCITVLFWCFLLLHLSMSGKV